MKLKRFVVALLSVGVFFSLACGSCEEAAQEAAEEAEAQSENGNKAGGGGDGELSEKKAEDLNP